MREGTRDGVLRERKDWQKMNIQWLKKGLAGTALALVLGIGGTTVLSTTAQAQDRDHWRDRDSSRQQAQRQQADRNRDWAARQQAERNRDWATRQQAERNRDWAARQQAQRNNDWARRQQIEREREWAYRNSRDRYVYVAPRVYPYGGYNGGYYGGYNGGYYGNYGGYSSYDQQKGFRDGLDRGQEDARDRRSFNPNNSEHFRNGNGAYRDGFRRGYEQGYRQYAGYRGW
jgi:hypothetical protein